MHGRTHSGKEHEGGQANALGRVGGWVWHKGTAIGFHQTLVSSRLPQAFVALANKECHCVLLPATQMKIVKPSPLLLDLQSNRRKLVWSI